MPGKRKQRSGRPVSLTLHLGVRLKHLIFNAPTNAFPKILYLLLILILSSSIAVADSSIDAISEDVRTEAIGQRVNPKDCHYIPLPVHLSGMSTFSRNGEASVGDVYSVPVSAVDHAMSFSIVEDALITASFDLHHGSRMNFKSITLYRLTGDSMSFADIGKSHPDDEDYANSFHSSALRRAAAVTANTVSNIVTGPGGKKSRAFISAMLKYSGTQRSDGEGSGSRLAGEISGKSKDGKSGSKGDDEADIPTHFQIVLEFLRDAQEGGSTGVPLEGKTLSCIPIRADIQIVPSRLHSLHLMESCPTESNLPEQQDQITLDNNGFLLNSELYDDHDTDELHENTYFYAFKGSDSWKPFSRGVWKQEVYVPRIYHQGVRITAEAGFRFVTGAVQILVEMKPAYNKLNKATVLDIDEESSSQPKCEHRCVSSTTFFNGQILDHTFPSGYLYTIWLMMGEPLTSHDPRTHCVEFSFSIEMKFVTSASAHDTAANTWMCPQARLPVQVAQTKETRQRDKKIPFSPSTMEEVVLGPRELKGRTVQFVDNFALQPNEVDGIEHSIFLYPVLDSVLKVVVYEGEGASEITLSLSTAKDDQEACRAVDIGTEQQPVRVLHCELKAGVQYELQIAVDLPRQGLALCEGFYMSFSMMPTEDADTAVGTCPRGGGYTSVKFDKVPTVSHKNFDPETWTQHTVQLTTSRRSRLVSIGKRTVNVPPLEGKAKGRGAKDEKRHERHFASRDRWYLRLAVESHPEADIRALVSDNEGRSIPVGHVNEFLGSYTTLYGPLETGTYVVNYFYVSRGTWKEDNVSCTVFKTDLRLLDTVTGEFADRLGKAKEHEKSHAFDDTDEESDDEVVRSKVAARDEDWCRSRLRQLPRVIEVTEYHPISFDTDFYVNNDFEDKFSDVYTIDTRRRYVTFKIEATTAIRIVLNEGNLGLTHRITQSLSVASSSGSPTVSSKSAKLFVVVQPGTYTWTIELTTSGTNLGLSTMNCPTIRVNLQAHPVSTIMGCPWNGQKANLMTPSVAHNYLFAFQPNLDLSTRLPPTSHKDMESIRPSLPSMAWLGLEVDVCGDKKSGSLKACREQIGTYRSWELTLTEASSSVRVEAYVTPSWLPVVVELTRVGGSGKHHSVRTMQARYIHSRLLLLQKELAPGKYKLTVKSSLAAFGQNESAGSKFKDALDNCAHVVVFAEVVAEDASVGSYLRSELLEVPDIFPVMPPPKCFNSVSWVSKPHTPILSTVVWTLKGRHNTHFHVSTPTVFRIAADPLVMSQHNLFVTVNKVGESKGEKVEVKALSHVFFFEDPAEYNIVFEGTRAFLITLSFSSVEAIERDYATIAKIPHRTISWKKVEKSCYDDYHDFPLPKWHEIGSDGSELSTGRTFYGLRVNKSPPSEGAQAFEWQFFVKEASTLIAEVDSDFLLDDYRVAVLVPEGRWVGEQRGRTSVLRISLNPGTYTLVVTQGGVITKEHDMIQSKILKTRCSRFELSARLIGIDSDLDEDPVSEELYDEDEELNDEEDGLMAAAPKDDSSSGSKESSKGGQPTVGAVNMSKDGKSKNDEKNSSASRSHSRHGGAPPSFRRHHGHQSQSSCQSEGAMLLPLDITAATGGNEAYGGPITVDGRFLIRCKILITDISGGRKRVFIDTSGVRPSRLVLKVGVSATLTSSSSSGSSDSIPSVYLTSHDGNMYSGVIAAYDEWIDSEVEAERLYLIGRGFNGHPSHTRGNLKTDIGTPDVSKVWLTFSHGSFEEQGGRSDRCRTFNLALQIAPLEDFKSGLTKPSASSWSLPWSSTTTEMTPPEFFNVRSLMEKDNRNFSATAPPYALNRTGRVSISSPEGFLIKIPIQITKFSHVAFNVQWNFLLGQIQTAIYENPKGYDLQRVHDSSIEFHLDGISLLQKGESRDPGEVSFQGDDDSPLLNTSNRDKSGSASHSAELQERDDGRDSEEESSEYEFAEVVRGQLTFGGAGDGPLTAKTSISTSLEPGSYILAIASDEMRGRGSAASTDNIWREIGIAAKDVVSLPMGLGLTVRRLWESAGEPSVVEVQPDPSVPIHHAAGLMIVLNLSHPPRDHRNLTRMWKMFSVKVTSTAARGKEKTVKADKVQMSDDSSGGLTWLLYWKPRTLELFDIKTNEPQREVTLHLSDKLTGIGSFGKPYKFENGPPTYTVTAPAALRPNPWPASKSSTLSSVLGGFLSSGSESSRSYPPSRHFGTKPERGGKWAPKVNPPVVATRRSVPMESPSVARIKQGRVVCEKGTEFDPRIGGCIVRDRQPSKWGLPIYFGVGLIIIYCVVARWLSPMLMRRAQRDAKGHISMTDYTGRSAYRGIGHHSDDDDIGRPSSDEGEPLGTIGGGYGRGGHKYHTGGRGGGAAVRRNYNRDDISDGEDHLIDLSRRGRGGQDQTRRKERVSPPVNVRGSSRPQSAKNANADYLMSSKSAAASRRMVVD